MYIIAGIIILFAVYYSLMIRFHNTRIESKILTAPYDLRPVKEQFEICVKSIADNSLRIIGATGGYFQIPDYYLKGYTPPIVYHYMDGMDISPSEEDVEKQMSVFISEKIPECTAMMNDVQKDAVLTARGNPVVKVDIRANSVHFDMNPDTGMEIQDVTYYELPIIYDINDVKIRDMLEISKSISEDHKEYNQICVSCLVDYSEEHGLKIIYQPVENNTVIYVMYDFGTKINNETLSFAMVHEYG